MITNLIYSKYLVIFLVIFMVSCVQMRDYTGIKDGSFGLDVKSGFDTGARDKDYYLVGEDTAIIIGDTKREVIFKIGLPTMIEAGLDGDECWLYDGKKNRAVS